MSKDNLSKGISRRNKKHGKTHLVSNVVLGTGLPPDLEGDVLTIGQSSGTKVGGLETSLSRVRNITETGELLKVVVGLGLVLGRVSGGVKEFNVLGVSSGNEGDISSAYVQALMMKLV